MSVLKWERGLLRTGAPASWHEAKTKIGCYTAYNDGTAYRGAKRLKRSTENLLAAKAACEADYIERCTEFLPLVKPGMVAVDESLLREVQVFLREQIDRWGAGPFAEGSARIERALLPRITAAIDAARNEVK